MEECPNCCNEGKLHDDGDERSPWASCPDCEAVGLVGALKDIECRLGQTLGGSKDDERPESWEQHGLRICAFAAAHGTVVGNELLSVIRAALAEYEKGWE